MIPHDLIGSRPIEFDQEPMQRRQERDVEMLARVIAAVILAGIGWGVYSLWGWL